MFIESILIICFGNVIRHHADHHCDRNDEVENILSLADHQGKYTDIAKKPVFRI